MSKTYRNPVATQLILRGNRGGGIHQNKSSKRKRTRSSQRQELEEALHEYLLEREEEKEEN